jgi:hypothetical protein
MKFRIKIPANVSFNIGVGDANQLPASTFQFAVDDIVWDSGTTTTGSWADVHYTVNNGTQQNGRMRLDGTTNTYSAGGLKIGDVVRYSFTYWDTARNYAVDTALQTYTMQ